MQKSTKTNYAFHFMSHLLCQLKPHLGKMKIEWGSQIRNYVMHPYKLVKDVRTAQETGNVDNVMNGDITPFLKAYLMLMGQKEQPDTL